MRACVLPTLTAGLLAWASLAEAQDIDSERFKPAVTHDGFVTAEGSGMRPDADRWELGLMVNYSRNPLVVVDGAGDITDRFVSGRLGFDVMASATIAEPFAVGIDIPFFLAQTGDADPSFAGLGDVRIVPKYRIADDRDVLGLALAAEVRAPTHVGDFAGGARNVVFAPRLIVDHRFPFGLRLGANAGAALREKTTFENIDAGSEILYAAAAAFRFGGTGGKTEVGAEVNGGVGVISPDVEEVPLEGLLYARHDPTDEWSILGGPAMGLVAGYGIPMVRVFAGVRYTPTAHDADHDGVTDDRDQCPQVAEDRDGDTDSDGCPEEDKDDDQDGVPNSKDVCPREKETINGEADDDGCPDQGERRVLVEQDQLSVLEQIRFRIGSAQIDPKSYKVLDQVALVIKANPNIKRVRVEGHTDETGSREYNLRLSKARAQAVREYLIRKGIAPTRLGAEGFGPDKPLVEGKDDVSRAKNRRVEFILEK